MIIIRISPKKYYYPTKTAKNDSTQLYRLRP